MLLFDSVAIPVLNYQAQKISAKPTFFGLYLKKYQNCVQKAAFKLSYHMTLLISCFDEFR